jgi:hypothetical protein
VLKIIFRCLQQGITAVSFLKHFKMYLCVCMYASVHMNIHTYVLIRASIFWLSRVPLTVNPTLPIHPSRINEMEAINWWHRSTHTCKTKLVNFKSKNVPIYLVLKIRQIPVVGSLLTNTKHLNISWMLSTEAMFGTNKWLINIAVRIWYELLWIHQQHITKGRVEEGSVMPKINNTP